MAKRKASKKNTEIRASHRIQNFPDFDARTLADAEAIKADKRRFGAAKREAKKMVVEESKKLNGLRKVARRKV